MTLKSKLVYWTLFRPKYWAGQQAREAEQKEQQGRGGATQHGDLCQVELINNSGASSQSRSS